MRRLEPLSRACARPAAKSRLAFEQQLARPLGSRCRADGSSTGWPPSASRSSPGSSRRARPARAGSGSSWISHGWSGRRGGGCRPPSVGEPGRTLVAERRRPSRGSTGCRRRTGGSRRRGPGTALDLLVDRRRCCSGKSGSGIFMFDERHEHLVRAGRQRAALLEQRDRRLVEAHEARGLHAQLLRQALQLARLRRAARSWVMNGTDASSVGQRRAGGRAARRSAKRAQRGQRVVERLAAPAGPPGACRAAAGSTPRAPRPRARARRW